MNLRSAVWLHSMDHPCYFLHGSGLASRALGIFKPNAGYRFRGKRTGSFRFRFRWIQNHPIETKQNSFSIPRAYLRNA